MASGTSNLAWATIGPVSNPASMRCTVAPVTDSPRRRVQKTGSAPRPEGRSDGWTLRMPSRGAARADLPSLQGKQAAMATSGGAARRISVASVAEADPPQRNALLAGESLGLGEDAARSPGQDDGGDGVAGVDQCGERRSRGCARLTEVQNAEGLKMSIRLWHDVRRITVRRRLTLLRGSPTVAGIPLCLSPGARKRPGEKENRARSCRAWCNA